MMDFDSMIKTSYAFDEKQFQANDWSVVRYLYNTNFPLRKSLKRIPKIIHQIWLGSPMPEKYKRLAETWKTLHPDWEYKLWTLEDVKSLNLENQHIFDTSTNWGMKSDIMRYEILKKFGGLYVDTDFECVKPFDDLSDLQFYTGIGYDGKLQLYIGLIACVPNHPIMEQCVFSLKREYNGTKGSIICNVTGANHFTQSFLKVVNLQSKLDENLNEGIVAFPQDYFYPFPNNKRTETNAYDYVKPHSYAIHHWEVSWIKQK